MRQEGLQHLVHWSELRPVDLSMGREGRRLNCVFCWARVMKKAKTWVKT